MATDGSGIVLLVSDNVWERHGDEIRSFAPGIEPVVYVGDEPATADQCARINTVFFSQDLWPERSRGFWVSIVKSPGIAWLQTFSAGVDSPVFLELMQKGVRLTNASGAAASPIAQTAILYMLALSRNVRAWMRHQGNHAWERVGFDELDGANLAVIGMGPIGAEIARLGVALNMNVEAVRRTPTGKEPCTTHGFDDLDRVLGRADWVASALPLTEDTHHIFDADRFARMKKGARFINVGRGELVDESALVDALRSGHIAGAGLDVFEVEPLPSDSPLWDMDNVIITPHSSGATSGSGLRAERIFVDNLRRYVNGDPLHNEVEI